MKLLPWERSILSCIDGNIKDLEKKIEIAENYLQGKIIDNNDVKFSHTIKNHPVWILLRLKKFDEKQFINGLLKLFNKEINNDNTSKISLFQKADQTINALKQSFELKLSAQYIDYYQNTNFDDIQFVLYKVQSLFEYFYLLAAGFICQKTCQLKSGTYHEMSDSEFAKVFMADYLVFLKIRIVHLNNLKDFYEF